MRGRPPKKIEREETLGINKYQFCSGCEYIRKTSKGDTCPARFNPYEPMTEPDGTPRTDGREGCPKNARYIERQKRERGEQ
jgi:hypothetical protein